MWKKYIRFWNHFAAYTHSSGDIKIYLMMYTSNMIEQMFLNHFKNMTHHKKNYAIHHTIFLTIKLIFFLFFSHIICHFSSRWEKKSNIWIQPQQTYYRHRSYRCDSIRNGFNTYHFVHKYNSQANAFEACTSSSILKRQRSVMCCFSRVFFFSISLYIIIIMCTISFIVWICLITVTHYIFLSCIYVCMAWHQNENHIEPNAISRIKQHNALPLLLPTAKL